MPWFANSGHMAAPRLLSTSGPGLASSQHLTRDPQLVQRERDQLRICPASRRDYHELSPVTRRIRHGNRIRHSPEVMLPQRPAVAGVDRVEHLAAARHEQEAASRHDRSGSATDA